MENTEYIKKKYLKAIFKERHCREINSHIKTSQYYLKTLFMLAVQDNSLQKNLGRWQKKKELCVDLVVIFIYYINKK